MSVVHTTRVLIMVVSPPADQQPVASFTFSPQTPGVGQTVSFDASSSFDPDGFIVSENWNFGDGQTGFGRFSFHTYNAPGNYTVTLTVTDNGGLSTTTTEIVPVHMMPPHDVAIDFVDTNPTTAVATQKVAIAVGIENTGSRDATVNITAFWDHNVAGTLQDVTVPANFGPFHQIFVFSITWDTTGVPIGNHTISAKISLVDDPTPADNSFTDGQVTILPPPTLTITPNSGSLGAKIVVKGTGFPSDFFGPQFTFIEVTFDGVFLGFVTTTNGTFSFTFDVPHSQPGPHLIKAFDQISGAHTSATFQVLPEPGSLVVTVNTAAIYFPGDTATIYVLTTIDGGPAGPNGLQIQLTLVGPNGSIATLKVVSGSPGLYKATYSIPTTNSTGTYTLVVTAHRTGTTDTLALSGFVVQPTWLSRHGPAIIGGTTIAGALGGIALAWRKGIFRKNNGDPTSGLEAE
jgi:PKD repeat protein